MAALQIQETDMIELDFVPYTESRQGSTEKQKEIPI